ncbi:MAG: carbonic anhydrase [Candidatus Anstonellales archaeon]
MNGLIRTFETNRARLTYNDFKLAHDLAEVGQKPKRVIITCSDSRVPDELFKERFIGENFVIRNAGNSLDNYALESLKYAVYHLKVREICIIGHTHCGAIKAYASNASDEFPAIFRAIHENIKLAPDIKDLEIANVIGLARRLREIFKDVDNLEINAYIYNIGEVSLVKLDWEIKKDIVVNKRI